MIKPTLSPNPKTSKTPGRIVSILVLVCTLAFFFSRSSLNKKLLLAHEQEVASALKSIEDAGKNGQLVSKQAMMTTPGEVVALKDDLVVQVTYKAKYVTRYNLTLPSRKISRGRVIIGDKIKEAQSCGTSLDGEFITESFCIPTETLSKEDIKFELYPCFEDNLKETYDDYDNCEDEDIVGKLYDDFWVGVAAKAKKISKAGISAAYEKSTSYLQPMSKADAVNSNLAEKAEAFLDSLDEALVESGETRQIYHGNPKNLDVAAPRVRNGFKLKFHPLPLWTDYVAEAYDAPEPGKMRFPQKSVAYLDYSEVKAERGKGSLRTHLTVNFKAAEGVSSGSVTTIGLSPALLAKSVLAFQWQPFVEEEMFISLLKETALFFLAFYLLGMGLLKLFGEDETALKRQLIARMFLTEDPNASSAKPAPISISELGGSGPKNLKPLELSKTDYLIASAPFSWFAGCCCSKRLDQALKDYRFIVEAEAQLTNDNLDAFEIMKAVRYLKHVRDERALSKHDDPFANRPTPYAADEGEIKNQNALLKSFLISSGDISYKHDNTMLSEVPLVETSTMKLMLESQPTLGAQSNPGKADDFLKNLEEANRITLDPTEQKHAPMIPGFDGDLLPKKKDHKSVVMTPGFEKDLLAPPSKNERQKIRKQQSVSSEKKGGPPLDAFKTYDTQDRTSNHSHKLGTPMRSESQISDAMSQLTNKEVEQISKIKSEAIRRQVTQSLLKKKQSESGLSQNSFADHASLRSISKSQAK